jgi:hypothetical protein
VPSWDVVNRRRWGPKPKLTDGTSRGARDVLLGLVACTSIGRGTVPVFLSSPAPKTFARGWGVGGGGRTPPVIYPVRRATRESADAGNATGPGHWSWRWTLWTGRWILDWTLESTYLTTTLQPLGTYAWHGDCTTHQVPPLGAFLRCTLQLQLQLRCGACVRYVRCSYDGTSVCAVVVLPRYCSCSAAPLSHGCAGREEKEEGRMTAKGEAVHFPTVLVFPLQFSPEAYDAVAIYSPRLRLRPVTLWMMMMMITPQQEGLGYDHDRESPPAIAAQNVIGVPALDASASSASPR